MKQEELKLLKKAVEGEWEMINSGLQLIRDSESYQKKSTHGISNQEYNEKMNKVVYDLMSILTKMKVYEYILADTFRCRLLKKANEIHRELLAYR